MPGLDPGIHAFLTKERTWVAGTSPAMTALMNPIDFIHEFIPLPI
jgi:hypothetical protein